MEQIIATAIKEYGNTPIPGTESNDEVLKYFKGIGFGGIKIDETPWCAAFANWILLQCGIKGTNNLTAQSFLEIGTATTSPRIGDIAVIFGNDKGIHWSHVTFFVKELGGFFYCLGGNQSNTVCVKAYPKTLPFCFRRVLDN